jgi:hypothetical protein
MTQPSERADADRANLPALSTRTKRFRSAWREHLDIKLDKLVIDVEGLADSKQKALATHYLTRARAAVQHEASFWQAIVGGWTGVDVERAWVSTHAAEVALLRGASLGQAKAMLPTIISECTPLLPERAKDDRVRTLQKAADSSHEHIEEADRALAAEVLESAYALSDAQHMRVRSFRNILIGTMFALAVLALLVGIIDCFAPHAVALCATAGPHASGGCPTGGGRPSGGDAFFVEVLGLAGAAITAVTAIRKLQGTSTPYAVPLMSLLLKLPTGAITALLGVILLRAGFGPSIKSLGQAQLIGYAVLFGAAQQLFLQFVDKRARAVLGKVKTAK